MQLRTSLPLIGLVALAPRLAEAATTYYVGPNGSDTAVGTSRDAPTTPSAVCEKLAAGDTVIFLDGVYTKQIMDLSKSGTEDAPITFRADDGAVPIIRGNGIGENQGAIGANADIGWLVFDGLWFEEWGSGGIEIDWDSKGCHDITIRHCVADRNGRNGFAPYNSKNVTIEYNIGSRNGYREDSWSSNFNIWASKGKIVVRGNVAFHGLDTSANKSDGNGFILDLALADSQALFENNIAFGNGGAGIAITDSGNAKLVGNTLYNNNKAANTGDFMLVDTCRSGTVDGVAVNGKAWTFSGLSLQNNAVIGSVKTSTPCGSPTYSKSDDLIGGSADVFQNASAGDLRPKAGSALVDKVDHGTTFENDIGFDPKCIKLETDSAKTQGYSWWTHAPDLDYIKKIGGIAKCWSPRKRPAGAKQELGAYELFTDGCTAAASCDDTDPCTDDTCDPTGQCAHTPKAGCGGVADAGATDGGVAESGTGQGDSGGGGRTQPDGGTAGKGSGGSKADGGDLGQGGSAKGGSSNRGSGGSAGRSESSAGDKSAGAGGSTAIGSGAKPGSGGATAGQTTGRGGGGGRVDNGTNDDDQNPPDNKSEGCSCSVPRETGSMKSGLLALASLAAALRLAGRRRNRGVAAQRSAS